MARRTWTPPSRGRAARPRRARTTSSGVEHRRATSAALPVPSSGGRSTTRVSKSSPRPSNRSPAATRARSAAGAPRESPAPSTARSWSVQPSACPTDVSPRSTSATPGPSGSPRADASRGRSRSRSTSRVRRSQVVRSSTASASATVLRPSPRWQLVTPMLRAAGPPMAARAPAHDSRTSGGTAGPHGAGSSLPQKAVGLATSVGTPICSPSLSVGGRAGRTTIVVSGGRWAASRRMLTTRSGPAGALRAAARCCPRRSARGRPPRPRHPTARCPWTPATTAGGG